MPNIAVIEPQPGDEITAPWGQSVADALNGIQAGSVSVTFTTTQANAAVTFPRAYVSAPNIVVMQPSAVCASGAQAITATGFTMVSRRTDGNASSTTQISQWIAIGVLA